MLMRRSNGCFNYLHFGIGIAMKNAEVATNS